MARDKTVSTSPTTMGKHGRLREEEAERAQGVKFEPFTPDKGPFEGSARGGAGPAPIASKPVEKAPETLVGPMLLSDVQAALSDRYPHNDIHTMEGATIEVKVPTGVILVDFKAVNKCKNTAELRAYIDSLPIQ